MADSITTRALRAADYDAVVRLWRQCEGVEVAEGDDRETFVRYLRRNPALSRVAVEGRRIVGAVLCGHDGRRGLIYHLAVAPALRGRGLGRRLVQECRRGLRACGIPRVLILVETGNRRGRDFWQAQGFAEIDGATPMGMNLRRPRR